MGEAIQSFVEMTGFSMIADDPKVLIMIAISLVLMYLAIVKKFEPLLLLPIAFGMLLTNLPGAEMYHRELFASGHVDWAKLSDQGGLIDYLYLGIKLGIYPCLIFMGVGAGTDFGPLIANPKTLFMGAAAQLGIFFPLTGIMVLRINDAGLSQFQVVQVQQVAVRSSGIHHIQADEHRTYQGLPNGRAAFDKKRHSFIRRHNGRIGKIPRLHCVA